MFCGIHLRALSYKDLKIPINKTRLKIEFLKSHPNFPGANELIAVKTYYSNSLLHVRLRGDEMYHSDQYHVIMNLILLLHCMYFMEKLYVTLQKYIPLAPMCICLKFYLHMILFELCNSFKLKFDNWYYITFEGVSVWHSCVLFAITL